MGFHYISLNRIQSQKVSSQSRKGDSTPVTGLNEPVLTWQCHLLRLKTMSANNIGTQR